MPIENEIFTVHRIKMVKGLNPINSINSMNSINSEFVSYADNFYGDKVS